MDRKLERALTSHRELMRLHIEALFTHDAAGDLVVVADGHAVSICRSVRQTGEAYEAGVETSPAYRGRGYAPCATTACHR